MLRYFLLFARCCCLGYVGLHGDAADDLIHVPKRFFKGLANGFVHGSSLTSWTASHMVARKLRHVEAERLFGDIVGFNVAER